MESGDSVVAQEGGLVLASVFSSFVSKSVRVLVLGLVVHTASSEFFGDSQVGVVRNQPLWSSR